MVRLVLKLKKSVSGIEILRFDIDRIHDDGHGSDLMTVVQTASQGVHQKPFAYSFTLMLTMNGQAGQKRSGHPWIFGQPFGKMRR